MLYLAGGIDMMGSYSISACKSLISKCVEPDELGKIFALVSSVESVVPIAIEQVYASLWTVTSDLGDPWVGACYLLSAVIVTLPLAAAIVALCRLGAKDISDLGRPEPVRPVFRVLEKRG